MDITVRIELPPQIRLDISDDLLALAQAFVERLGGAIAMPMPVADAPAPAAAPEPARKEAAAIGIPEAVAPALPAASEPGCPAKPDPEAPPPVFGRGWATEARRGVLCRDWPLGVPVDEIRRRLEALPGRPPPGNGPIGQMAVYLGLRRPPGFGTGQRSGPKPGAPAPPVPAAAVPADARVRGGWITDERKAVMRRDWPRGVEVSEISRRLAALPGPVLPRDNHLIGSLAQNLGLRRPPGYDCQRVRERRGGGEQAEPLRAPVAPPPPAVPAALVTRDGAFSVAGAEDARNAALSAGPVVVDFADVEAWAGSNRIEAAPWQILSAVNAAREQHGLPRFHVPLEQLPGRQIAAACPVPRHGGAD